MLRDGTPIIYPKNKEVMPGPETTFASIGPEWANVSNMPFRFWKARMYEGGICTPMIAYWNNGIKLKKGSVNNEMCHIIDFMATCIDLAQAKYPAKYNENRILPLAGKSLIPILQTGKRKGHDIIGFEHFNEKAMMNKDGWKIIQSGRKEALWELYNLNIDRTEKNNVADKYPKRLKQMISQYKAWAKRTMVFPAPPQ
jgi:arylsulfatase